MACPAISGGSEVTIKPLVPRLSVREGFLALTLPVPMAEQSKTLDLESELEIAQVRILSGPLQFLLVPSTTVSTLLLICLIGFSHRPVAHGDGRIGDKRGSASP
ncbi:hypothetical protein J6590_031887 [Homalodisca vitripennis]|nr:hypothetical protein J6590_031887 [Homalodisca vitripennis]